MNNETRDLIFRKMNNKFYLSSNDRKIGGVCGGLAEYIGMDSLLVRLAAFFLILAYGVGLWIYLLLWLLAPRQRS